MTRKVHDQFAKGFLGDLLSQAGSVQPGYTLSSEVKEIDLLFQPDSGAIASLQNLGLLGRMASSFCLIEPYRNPVQGADLRTCLSKVLEVSNQQEREAKQQKIPLKQVVLPRLWILSPTASPALVESFQASSSQPGERVSTSSLNPCLRRSWSSINFPQRLIQCGYGC